VHNNLEVNEYLVKANFDFDLKPSSYFGAFSSSITLSKREVDALGVITISRGCFERCCSNKKTPPYRSNLSLVTLRTRRPTLLRAPAYRTPSEASPWRRCGHASQFLRGPTKRHGVDGYFVVCVCSVCWPASPFSGGVRLGRSSAGQLDWCRPGGVWLIVIII